MTKIRLPDSEAAPSLDHPAGWPKGNPEELGVALPAAVAVELVVRMKEKPTLRSGEPQGHWVRKLRSRRIQS